MPQQLLTKGAAGFVVFVLAGCTSLDLGGFILGRDNSGRPELLVAASVNTVSEEAQALLSKKGLTVFASREGENVRILGKTRSGGQITLILTREQTKDSEKTRVRLELKGAGKGELFVTFLTELEAACRPEG